MLFGLIGKKLSHSFSQTYFREKFSKENIVADYLLFEMESLEEFPAILKKFPNLVGLNVTVPYKQEIMPLLDEIDPIAKSVGAVNTILIKDGKTIGYNTDIYGFKYSLEEFVPPGFNENVLILGTGGAAKAVDYALKSFWGIDSACFASRTPDGPMEFAYPDIHPNLFRSFSLVINTTPLGMYPDVQSCADLPYQSLWKGQYLYDLVYNPEETLFLKRGRLSGCKVKSGLDMLHGQAERAWEIWNQEA